MRRTGLRVLLLPVVAFLLAPACASRQRPPHAGMASIWRGYSEMRPYRAIAIAGDPDGVWVGAAAGSADSRAEAEQAVLSECRRKRMQRRMQASCRLYAVGDDVVWGAR